MQIILRLKILQYHLFVLFGKITVSQVYFNDDGQKMVDWTKAICRCCANFCLLAENCMRLAVT